MGRHLSQ